MKDLLWLLTFMRNAEPFGDGISGGQISDSFNWKAKNVTCRHSQNSHKSFVTPQQAKQCAQCHHIPSSPWTQLALICLLACDDGPSLPKQKSLQQLAAKLNGKVLHRGQLGNSFKIFNNNKTT